MVFVNNIDPILFGIGPVMILWYGLFFALGLVLNYIIIRWAFRRQRYSVDDLDSLVLYLFFGLVIGARLGHVIFYNWAYFSAHPVDILQIWNGGLSSHGATIGIVLAVALWSYIHKKNFAKYSDLLVLGIPLTAGFVRIGNFFNSEILGTPTGGNYGVIFEKLNENFARHPVQLYESAACFLIFGILLYIYKKYFEKLPSLFLTFSFFLLYFTARFILEYRKDLHILPASFPLSMGQVLSILPILLSLIYFGWLLTKKFSAAK